MVIVTQEPAKSIVYGVGWGGMQQPAFEWMALGLVADKMSCQEVNPSGKRTIGRGLSRPHRDTSGN